MRCPNIIRLHPEVSSSDGSRNESAGQMHMLVVKSGSIHMLLRPWLAPPPPPREQQAPTSGLASPRLASRRLTVTSCAEYSHTAIARAFHPISTPSTQNKEKKKASNRPHHPGPIARRVSHLASATLSHETITTVLTALFPDMVLDVIVAELEPVKYNPPP